MPALAKRKRFTLKCYLKLILLKYLKSDFYSTVFNT